jgi:hypothetical protein
MVELSIFSCNKNSDNKGLLLLLEAEAAASACKEMPLLLSEHQIWLLVSILLRGNVWTIRKQKPSARTSVYTMFTRTSEHAVLWNLMAAWHPSSFAHIFSLALAMSFIITSYFLSPACLPNREDSLSLGYLLNTSLLCHHQLSSVLN